MTSLAPWSLIVAPALYLAGAALALACWGRPAAARWAAGLFGLLGGLAGAGLALVALLGSGQTHLYLFQTAPYASLGLRLDPLAAWFLLLISAVAAAVSLAGLGYARAYDRHGGARLAAATSLFLASMTLVVLADGGFGFLLAWEAMSLASYLLVVHEHHDRAVERAGYIYLVMTHVGTAFLIGALLLLFVAAGDFDFERLRQAAAGLPAWQRDVVFLLGLVGFATKAGVVPLHVWLPRAHPAAPSHVSALMSGVMLKTAIYGLVRLAWDLLGGGPAWWGGLLLALGVVSAVLGVLYALMEHDLKRLLAFHSVENVGIILIGLGAALMLAAFDQPALAALALAAGLFHSLNHALFKSLLFLAAGAIHQAAGTRDLERLGGLIHRMPWTAALFLLGAAAISALPPLNGFASEWLTFQGLLGLGQAAPAAWIAVGAALAAGLLALTGPLAAACFVKAFGVAFLALPRTTGAAEATESPLALRLGMGWLAGGCVLLGLLPGLALGLLGPVTRALTGAPLPESSGQPFATGLAGPGAARLEPLAVLGAILAIAAGGLLLARLLRAGPARRAPTWACGFGLEPRMQYGALAFAKPIRLFFRAVVQPERAIEAEYEHSPYLPTRLRYRAGIRPVFERTLYRPPRAALLWAAARIQALQNGGIRLYLGYVFATLVALLLIAR